MLPGAETGYDVTNSGSQPKSILLSSVTANLAMMKAKSILDEKKKKGPHHINSKAQPSLLVHRVYIIQQQQQQQILTQSM